MTTRQGRILETVERNLPLSDVLVIDCHVHLGDAAGNFIPWPDAEGMLVSMDSVGINQSCVSSLRSLTSDVRTGNDEVIALTGRYPDRFIGYAVANPNYSDQMEGELERCFRHAGIQGIKIHPASYIHNYPIDGPNYHPVWEFARQRGCPVLTHAGPGTEWHTCGPRGIAAVAESYPEVNLIIGHSGSYHSMAALDEFIAVVRRYANLYLDTSAMGRFYRSVDYMVQHVGAERVLYGTDAPWHSFIAEFGPIVYARISDAEKEKILGLNMARLLDRA
ncbi:MAG: amidohydrolase family protein [Ardenticatenaceae bacterium]|nr:amidohydrolase family protein [Ardenticatenaceae bacterium]HBY93368.1 hypothetical protein [Chloroflexota bacterium]